MRFQLTYITFSILANIDSRSDINLTSKSANDKLLCYEIMVKHI